VFFLVPEVAACGDAAPASVLALALARDGLPVAVGVLGPATGSEADELRAAGVVVHSVPIRHALDFNGARVLRRTVQEANPAVVHAWGPVAARAARLAVSRRRDGGNAPRLVASAAAMPGGGLGGWLVARQLRRADRVAPATRADGDRYRRLGVPAEVLTLIPPAAPRPAPEPDRDDFCRGLGIPPGSRLVVVGGRSERGVGPKDAIVAFDMLRYDAKDLHLVVFGAGADATALEQFGRALAFDDFRVRFAPCPEGRAAAVRLAEAVFVTSPRGAVEEALEAMAAGKPVVGWRTSELSEIVDDGVTGVLVPPGDRTALAACARSLLDDPATIVRMGRAARARAAERFGLARMTEQFARLYAELVML
jgi:glycosyltransferase involved in cell wall biosynthesis